MARRLAPALTAAASLALAALAAPCAPPAAADPGPGRALGDRALVYAATARFQVHANAVAAGYKPDQYCVVDKAGTGALGYPHFNHKYDNSVDPAKPAALFYEDDGRGGKRLVAVQWLVYGRARR
ncbi:hypothetical protein [Streptomyces avidinii]